MRRAGTVLRADVALGPDNRSKGQSPLRTASPPMSFSLAMDADGAALFLQATAWS